RYFAASPGPSVCPLSLHDALPISLVRPVEFSGCGLGTSNTRRGHGPDRHGVCRRRRVSGGASGGKRRVFPRRSTCLLAAGIRGRDRKSTRLNSSHVKTTYAVFCLT